MRPIQTFWEGNETLSWEGWKVKKRLLYDHFYSNRYNHPHRVERIDLSGTLSYVVDERDFTSTGSSAKKYDASLDFSLFPGYERQFVENSPWGVDEPLILTQGQFIFYHQVRSMWAIQMETENYAAADTIKIGEVDIQNYSWNGTDWIAGTSSTEDIDLAFDFSLTAAGGEAASGGKDDATPAEITPLFGFGTAFPYLSAIAFDAAFERFPWTASWASEDLSGIFSTHISDSNTADGGGHSGSCSLSIDFTNQA